MGKLFCLTELHSISKLPQNELTLRRVIPFFFLLSLFLGVRLLACPIPDVEIWFEPERDIFHSVSVERI